MMRYFIICLLSIGAMAAHSAEVPVVELQTSMGPIVLELNPEKAPKSVENFLSYAKEGFYEGTIFHRVISDFMVQGGGYTKDLEKKPTRPPVANEAANGLKNVRGAVAMARTADPDSATSQFFINIKDNDFLDYRPSIAGGAGYTVFAKVIKGMETIDKIQQVTTGAAGPFQKDVPQTPVVIEKVKVSKTATTPDSAASPTDGNKAEIKSSQPPAPPEKAPKPKPASSEAASKAESEKAPLKTETAATHTEKSPASTDKSSAPATDVKTVVDDKAAENAPAKAKTVAPTDKALPAPDAPSKPDKPEAPPS